ncbi:hypothetical protein [Marinobacter sp. MMG032]|uniref:Uncharacterized protein n=1 Tax=Marinobacter sp. MMG032 TaxID=3158548 RepID=A0AAU7MSW3_9GAMM
MPTEQRLDSEYFTSLKANLRLISKLEFLPVQRSYKRRLQNSQVALMRSQLFGVKGICSALRMTNRQLGVPQ